tara:strand:- start:3730 stop:4053 length:324 start_codon:yes stop_codon:yes gene_type:complete
MAFTIKKGDTAPFLTATLKDANGTAVDLTGATVVFNMADLDDNLVVTNGSCTIVDEDTGRIRYNWVTTDTANDGVFRGEFTVTFASGVIETFPNSTYFRIKILDDLG